MPSATPSPDSAPVPDKPSSAPIDQQELARRARAQASDQRAKLRQGRRRRIPRFRLVLWGVELAILLGCVEFAIRRRVRSRPPAGDAKVHEVGMVPAPPRAAGTVEVASCNEVAGTLLAAIDSLAEGSEVMRDAQVEYADKSGLPIEIENSIGMRFRLVPPGSCVVGSPLDEKGRGVVEPQHVRIVYRPFYLGKFEVTQEEFTKLMGRNPSGFPGPRRPVEEITWHDAQRFCIALNEREGLPKNTYRLPAEAEWEYACRAGTSTAYYSGNTPADGNRVAETADNNYRSTVNVGGRPPNALGLYNMHGNVWEWCLDYYTRYPNDETPITADEKRSRCLRGGNWRVHVVDCRSAERSRMGATSHGNMLGFRVLRTVPELRNEGAGDILPLDSLP